MNPASDGTSSSAFATAKDNAGTSASDGIWDSVLHVKAPAPVIKRSNSAHLRFASATGVSEKRSVSAERAVRAAAPIRQRERFVPLPLPQHQEADREEEEDESVDTSSTAVHRNSMEIIQREPSGISTPIDSSVFQEPGTPPGDPQGRIIVLNSCEAYEEDQTVQVLRKEMPNSDVRTYPEVVYVNIHPADTGGKRTPERISAGEVFIFDYGITICWGLDRPAEEQIMEVLQPCQVKPLLPKDVHTDDLTFTYSRDRPPHIQNDCITIPTSQALDHKVKMAISHALAQSSKLDLYEARMALLVKQVRHLPESLARYGEVKLPKKQMAKIKGQVFILKSEIYLLSTVLDTPDFFWEAPDSLRQLYDKVCEYCALEDRIELMNSRILLIQSMLRIWSDHSAHHHLARLDNVVIILIIMEVIIAAAEVVGFFRPLHRGSSGVPGL